MPGTRPGMTDVVGLFLFPEQRRKTLLALAGELDHAASGRRIARRPFQFGETGEQRRAERAGQMMTPLAPVETGLANRAARMAERIRIDLQRAFEEALAFACQFDVVLVLTHQLLPAQAVEHLHAEVARQVVVADARAPQRRILRPGAHAHVAGTGGERRETLQHAADVGIGEAVVTVPALLFLFDQAAGLEL